MALDNRADIAAAAAPTAQMRPEISEDGDRAVFLGVCDKIGGGGDGAILAPMLEPVAARSVVAPDRDRIARGSSVAESCSTPVWWHGRWHAYDPANGRRDASAGEPSFVGTKAMFAEHGVMPPRQ
jgi:hypothetical protein